MRILITVAALAVSASALAAPIQHPSGSNLTYGSASNTQLLSTYTNNPAAPAMVLNWSDWNIKLGVISSIGVGVEVGNVDNMIDEIDALSTELENQNNMDVQQAEDLKQRFDDFLLDAGENGYANASLHLQIPLMPLVLSSRNFLGGTLVLDMNSGVLVGLSVLDSPLSYNPLAPADARLETNTALYLKAAQVTEMSVGYSRPVITLNNGTVTFGVRLHYYKAGLRKTLVGVAVADDIDTLIEEEQDKDLEYQNAVGGDLGLLWQTGNYRVGAMVKNINSPSIEYDAIGQNCAQLSGASQDSCYIAQSYSNEIDLNETWVMNPQGNIEAAYFSNSRNWNVNMTMDTNSVNDAIGNQYQWAVFSAGYASDSWLIPGIRLGYRKNMAGSELSYAQLGLTLFKGLNVDAASSIETIEVDGKSRPRSFYLNVGLELLF